MPVPREVIPLICPTSIGVADLPVEFAFQEVVVNGQRRILMQVVNPQGVAFHFMSPDAAKAIAERLTELAGGIVVAPASALPR